MRRFDSIEFHGKSVTIHDTSMKVPGRTAYALLNERFQNDKITTTIVNRNRRRRKKNALGNSFKSGQLFGGYKRERKRENGIFDHTSVTCMV